MHETNSVIQYLVQFLLNYSYTLLGKKKKLHEEYDEPCVLRVLVIC